MKGQGRFLMNMDEKKIFLSQMSRFDLFEK